MNIVNAPRILQGIVGSHAYGLAHADSDIDRLAVGVLPKERFLGLFPPVESDKTYHHVGDEDITVHELAKFVGLCLKANPMATELLWLDGWDVLTDFGIELVQNRERLLSQRHVQGAYSGYLTSQLRKASIENSLAQREKFGRHAWRLAHQGASLWRTGVLEVRLTSEQVAEATAFGKRKNDALFDRLLRWTQAQFEMPTPLSETADLEWAEDFVQRVRASLG